MPDKPRSQAILSDIACMSDLATQPLGKGKNYEVLLRYLLSLNLLHEDATLPAMKDITVAPDLSYSKIRKQLKAIYEDLTGEEEYNIEKKYNKVHYDLTIKAWGVIPLFPKKNHCQSI